MVAGPYAAMMLADMGADVIKVESGTGDPARNLGSLMLGEDSVAFHSVNRNKRGMKLDLTSDDGRTRLDELLSDSDILIHNSLPRIAANLGLRGTDLLARHPHLIVTEISGFNPTGPEAERPAYDIIIAAMSGLMSVTGETDGRPLRPNAPMIDFSTGVYAAMGALAALIHRDQTGQGQIVSVNMMEVAVNLQSTNFSHFFASGSQPRRVANGSYFAVSNCFKTSDSWLAVAVGNDSMWRRLVDALDSEDVASPLYDTNPARLQRSLELEEKLSAIFLTRSTDEWMARLNEFNVPNSEVQDYQATVDYLRANDHDVLWEYQREDAGIVPVIGSPFTFSNADLRVYRPAPRLKREQ